MQTIASIFVDAFTYGTVLFIISMGLMRVINLAHRACTMIGGYFAASAVTTLGMNYFAATVLAVALTVIIAIPAERFLYRRIYGTPDLTQVLMTISITFFIIGATNYIADSTLKSIPLPEFLRGSVDIGFRSLARQRMFVIIAGMVVTAALWFLIERTNFGIKLRATVDNADMTQSLGVCTQIIYALSFTLAIARAALGGRIAWERTPEELGSAP